MSGLALLIHAGLTRSAGGGPGPGPGAYVYYRLLVTTLQSGNDGWLSINTFALRETVDGTNVALDTSNGTGSSVSGTHPSFPAALAFDDDVSTRALMNTTLPADLVFEFAAARGITQYGVGGGVGAEGGSGPSRCPKAWKLQASNDGSSWVDLDEQVDQTGWTNGSVRWFAL